MDKQNIIYQKVNITTWVVLDLQTSTSYKSSKICSKITTWVVLDLQTSTSYKSSKIVLLESLQIAVLIPLADHSLWSWAGRPLKSSLVMSLKQWSSSRSMIWLHNTCVTCSPKTLLAPPATSGTLRLILGCQRKIQQMGKNASLSGELNYGIAFLLSLKRHLK